MINETKKIQRYSHLNTKKKTQFYRYLHLISHVDKDKLIQLKHTYIYKWKSAFFLMKWETDIETLLRINKTILLV